MRPDIVAYHPRAVVVIGRSHDWGETKLHALHGLNSRMHGITGMTYDRLISPCHALLSHVTTVNETPEAAACAARKVVVAGGSGDGSSAGRMPR
ncbi:hypothetical protein [Streptomyces sp. P9-A2]|uniref:hypothetical protein n=1 Tax=Streptomyces sp. P9-A2 TaxID=3072284 RepID=UPI002FC662A5